MRPWNPTWRGREVGVTMSLLHSNHPGDSSATLWPLNDCVVLESDVVTAVEHTGDSSPAAQALNDCEG